MSERKPGFRLLTPDEITQTFIQMTEEIERLNARIAELEILVAKSEAKLGSWDMD